MDIENIELSDMDSDWTFEPTKTKFHAGLLNDGHDDGTWWLHGQHEEHGVLFEFYGDLDEIVSELKRIECKAFIGNEYSIPLLYEKSSKLHSFQDYFNFLKPMK